MKLRLDIIAVVTSAIHAAKAIVVTPNSPCAAQCGNVLDSNSPADIVCSSSAYQGTSAGIVFRNCIQCQLTSSYYVGEGSRLRDSDLGSMLYNLRYATSYCLFGQPNNTNWVDNPCVTKFACGSFEDAIRVSNSILPHNESIYQYCDAWALGDVHGCSNCIGQGEMFFAIRNFLTILDTACQQRPPASRILGFTGQPFTNEKINATGVTAIGNPSDYRPGRFPVGSRIAVAIGVIVLLLVGAGCFVVCRGKRRRRRFLKSLEKQPQYTTEWMPEQRSRSGGYRGGREGEPSFFANTNNDDMSGNNDGEGWKSVHAAWRQDTYCPGCTAALENGRGSRCCSHAVLASAEAQAATLNGQRPPSWNFGWSREHIQQQQEMWQHLAAEQAHRRMYGGSGDVGLWEINIPPPPPLPPPPPPPPPMLPPMVLPMPVPRLKMPVPRHARQPQSAPAPQQAPQVDEKSIAQQFAALQQPPQLKIDMVAPVCSNSGVCKGVEGELKPAVVYDSASPTTLVTTLTPASPVAFSTATTVSWGPSGRHDADATSSSCCGNSTDMKGKAEGNCCEKTCLDVQCSNARSCRSGDVCSPVSSPIKDDRHDSNSATRQQHSDLRNARSLSPVAGSAHGPMAYPAQPLSPINEVNRESGSMSDQQPRVGDLSLLQQSCPQGHHQAHLQPAQHQYQPQCYQQQFQQYYQPPKDQPQSPSVPQYQPQYHVQYQQYYTGQQNPSDAEQHGTTDSDAIVGVAISTRIADNTTSCKDPAQQQRQQQLERVDESAAAAVARISTQSAGPSSAMPVSPAASYPTKDLQEHPDGLLQSKDPPR